MLQVYFNFSSQLALIVPLRNVCISFMAGIMNKGNIDSHNWETAKHLVLVD